MKHLSRSTALKIAAIISFSVAAIGLFSSIPLLIQGATAINQAGSTPPYFVLLIGAMLSPLAMFGAYGAWHNQRWGVVLLILTSAIDLISALPGILFAPTLFLRLLSALAIPLDGGTILLCLWREPRQSSTLSRTAGRKQ